MRSASVLPLVPGLTLAVVLFGCRAEELVLDPHSGTEDAGLVQSADADLPDADRVFEIDPTAVEGGGVSDGRLAGRLTSLVGHLEGGSYILEASLAARLDNRIFWSALHFPPNRGLILNVDVRRFMPFMEMSTHRDRELSVNLPLGANALRIEILSNAYPPVTPTWRVLALDPLQSTVTLPEVPPSIADPMGTQPYNVLITALEIEALAITDLAFRELDSKVRRSTSVLVN